MIVKGVNEQDVVSYVVDTWKQLDNARSAKIDIWSRCIKAYLFSWDKAWIDAVKKDNRSARYFPAIWDTTENVVSQIGALLFPKDWFDVEPIKRGGEDWDDSFARDCKLVVSDQHERMKFIHTVKQPILRPLVVVGNVPWTIQWRQEMAVDYSRYSQEMTEWVQ